MGAVSVDAGEHHGPHMTQLTIWDEMRRWYARDYYARNRHRRCAQRLASKWGGSWRDYLRGCV